MPKKRSYKKKSIRKNKLSRNPRKSLKKSQGFLKKKSIKRSVKRIKGKGSFLKKYYNIMSNSILKRRISGGDKNEKDCSQLTYELCSKTRQQNGVRGCRYNLKDQICESI